LFAGYPVLRLGDKILIMSEACGQCAVNVNYDQRFEWLDGLRGVALVMMVVYHLIWNLGGTSGKEWQIGLYFGGDGKQ